MFPPSMSFHFWMRQDLRALSSMTAEESYNKAKMQLRELAEGLLNKKARVEHGTGTRKKGMKKKSEKHRKTFDDF